MWYACWQRVNRNTCKDVCDVNRLLGARFHETVPELYFIDDCFGATFFSSEELNHLSHQSILSFESLYGG